MRRVVLKLSGEAFADPELGYGIDPLTVVRVAEEVAEAHAGSVQIAVVVGGGGSACETGGGGCVGVSFE